MNNVLTKTQAANERLARLVKHGVVACMLACSAAGALAAGQDRGPRREDMQQQQPSMRERFDARVQDQRYDRGFEMQMREDAMRREAERARMEQQRDDARRGGRMTPDERRDLRRQINEAGMDLYPNARRR